MRSLSRTGDNLKTQEQGAQRRRWERLPISFPVFVRGIDDKGKQFVEFATALNISAGGALLAMRRYLKPTTIVSIEIPTPPTTEKGAVSSAVRSLRGQIVGIQNTEPCHMLGLKFSKPLNTISANHKEKRKSASAK